jgi:hypothetical protein
VAVSVDVGVKVAVGGIAVSVEAIVGETSVTLGAVSEGISGVLVLLHRQKVRQQQKKRW